MAVMSTNQSMAVMSSSKSVEWYTPAHIIQAATAVLGRVDLDPASCLIANQTVGATKFYALPQDGLTLPWAGAVWLNPPFGAAIDPWVERLDHDYQRGSITAALALVPARVDTAWWSRLSEYPVCFLRGRLRYSGAENSAPFPTAIFYLGSEERRFLDVFSHLGNIYRCVSKSRPQVRQLLLVGETLAGENRR